MPLYDLSTVVPNCGSQTRNKAFHAVAEEGFAQLYDLFQGKCAPVLHPLLIHGDACVVEETEHEVLPVVVKACEEERLFPGLAHKAVHHGVAKACVGGVADDLFVDDALFIGKQKELPVDVAEFLRQLVVGDTLKVAGREPFQLFPEEILQGRVIPIEGLLVDLRPCAQLLYGHVLVV